MPDHLREAVLHTLVAALVVTAVVRFWRLDDPALKLRLRLFVVAMPLLLLPAFELVAPFRHQPRFEDGAALFVGRRWAAVSLWGVAADQLFLGGAVALSAVLLVLDFGPWIREWRETRWDRVRALPVPEALAGRVAALSAALGVTPPRLVVPEVEGAVLFCRGVRRPALYVSPATLALLDAEELDGALAHELAHLAGHDVRLGWLLVGARLLQAWNPVVQVMARVIALDAERRADDTAARVTGKPLAVASGLVAMFRASAQSPPAHEVMLQAALRRARESTIEGRCRRLMHARPVAPLRRALFLTAVTAGSVAALAFFVT